MPSMDGGLVLHDALCICRLTLDVCMAASQQRSAFDGRKVSNQHSADEPDYNVPDYYPEDQDGLGGSCDLEIER